MIKKLETFESALQNAQKENKKLYEIAQIYEAQEHEISIEKVRHECVSYLNAMGEAIKKGIKSKEIAPSKMCGFNTQKLKEYHAQDRSILSKVQQNILLYSLATAEENARMGKIVACPTAGSCGIVPSVIIALAEEKNLSEDEKINALLTAGIIGKIISNKVAISGAVMGCQGECGVASAMAAGAVVEIFAGSNMQIVQSAALALKNIMGLVCDPIAGLVEVPCVKRNPFLAFYSLAAAELAMADIKSFIPPDEVVDAMHQVGLLMSPQLRETSQAGLATTKTGIEVKQNLEGIWQS